MPSGHGILCCTCYNHERAIPLTQPCWPSRKPKQSFCLPSSIAEQIMQKFWMVENVSSKHSQANLRHSNKPVTQLLLYLSDYNLYSYVVWKCNKYFLQQEFLDRIDPSTFVKSSYCGKTPEFFNFILFKLSCWNALNSEQGVFERLSTRRKPEHCQLWRVILKPMILRYKMKRKLCQQ